MITTQHNRLDPSLLDREVLDRLVAAFSKENHVALIDKQGHRTEIPEPIYQQLMRIMQMMQKGSAIILMREDEKLTTQAAANYLGVSRQYLVNLLEEGTVPFHKVGTHRRITFRDLLDYEKSRDQARRESLDRMSKMIDEAGLYDASYIGEE